MMAKMIFTTALFAFMHAVLFSQSPPIVFQKKIGGTNSDFVTAMEKVDGGGYVVSAVSFSSDVDFHINRGFRDMWLVKLNDAYEIEWKTNVGGSGDDYPSALVQTSDGGFAVVGYSTSNNFDFTTNNGERDAFIIKFNGQGQTQWIKTFGGSSSDVFNSVINTADDGFLIAGSTESPIDGVEAHGETDAWVVKLDSEGNIDWQKLVGGSSDDYGEKICISEDGGFVLAGLSYSLDFDYSDCEFSGGRMVKFNSEGNIEWVTCLFSGVISDMDKTSDGGYVVATDDFNMEWNRDILIIKINDEGEVVWEQFYGGYGSEQSYAIRTTSDGGYIVGGHSRSMAGGFITEHFGEEDIPDCWLLKLDSNGDLIWQEVFGGTSIDEIVDVLELEPGAFLVANNSGSQDGDCTSYIGFTDVWLVQFGGTVGVNEVSKSSLQINLYPNPTHSFLTIDYNFPITEIHIYNSQGQRIRTEKRKSFSVESLPNGIYTVQVFSKEGGHTAQFIKY